MTDHIEGALSTMHPTVAKLVEEVRDLPMSMSETLPASADEVRSMGATFIDLQLDALEGAGGYAREMTEDRAVRQRELLTPYGLRTLARGCTACPLWEGTTLHDLYEAAYLPWEWQPRLKSIASDLGLDCFSSPFDPARRDAASSDRTGSALPTRLGHRRPIRFRLACRSKLACQFPVHQLPRPLPHLLHNPASDRRTTQGIFHIAGFGLPVPDDAGRPRRVPRPRAPRPAARRGREALLRAPDGLVPDGRRPADLGGQPVG